MFEFNRLYAQVLAFIRQLLHLENSNRPRNSRQNMFTGLGRLGLAPSGPRPGSNGNLGHYTEQSSQVKRHKYSYQEVKRILRGLEKGEWAFPVMLQAATFKVYGRLSQPLSYYATHLTAAGWAALNATASEAKRLGR